MRTYARAWVSACACVWVHGSWRVCARVALLIQRATRRHSHLRHLWIRHIFRYYLINGMIFVKTLLNRKCVLFFSKISSKTFLTLRKIQRAIVIDEKTSSCKVLVILVGF